jgi:hypothetical protein
MANPNPVPINTLVMLTATETAAAGRTVVSAEYRIDSNPYQPMTASDGMFNSQTENVKATISFSSAGVYTVCVRGTDSAGFTGCEECIFVAVYDVNAGFVTGGGWIISPPGALVAQPSATGRANFGFVSKYQKGATVPTGNTEFQFQTGNFNFHSESYDWLVISGAKARYRGTGTINGSGTYKFELTAWDGDLSGSPNDTDRFRIKIWDSTGTIVIYNNEMANPDGGTPTTVLGGGSIVIHK